MSVFFSQVRRLFRSLVGLFHGYLQCVLILAFILVATVPLLVGTMAISRSIQDYLQKAQRERVDRDMSLASAFYDIKLTEMAGIAHRLVLDEGMISNLSAASLGDTEARAAIDCLIANEVTVLALGGSHFIAVLDQSGRVVAGRTVSQIGTQSPVPAGGDWFNLTIVKSCVAAALPAAATEVVPAEYLASVGLAEQAYIPLVDTPRAEPVPFDPREGTAGLVAIGVAPIRDANWRVLGAAVALHLYNRDYALVDRVKEVAGVDTVTIFLGDQRVSTNVLTLEGERAIGTRLSEEVVRTVLRQGYDYSGRAFVVKENYLTRYRPLRDHTGAVVGILYVGAREASFLTLVKSFTSRAIAISLLSNFLVLVLAVPIARSITLPIVRLVSANRSVARGDMHVRVPVRGRGELVTLGRSFNSMVQELQATQDQLVQAEKLASLGQLAAGVAHELNNPLGTVLLYSDVALKEMDAADPHRDDLKVIVRETTRCKDIVTALLNFARQQRLSAQPTNVNQIIDELLTELALQPQAARVAVKRDLAPDLPVVQADGSQMRQVLVNLVSNALDAMPDGGELTVRTSVLPDLESIRIEVADTGCGIPEENLPKLFEPFFTTKPPGRGTGLGLAIVYGIVKMHRGQIQAQSRVGAGTTFSITLPVRMSGGPPLAGTLWL